MKKALLLSAVLLVSLGSFASTSINNFTDYNDSWAPLGDPSAYTQTYGEVFTAPNGDTNLTSFSFYMGSPYAAGNIVLGGYLATWDGQKAGTLLYSSNETTYDNVGDEELTFSGVDKLLMPGHQYVIFLTTSQYHGDSTGAAHVSSGSANDNLNGFAYFNNGGSFDSLFFSPWDEHGLSPDWAVDIELNGTPEPGSLGLFGSGILSALAILRRKLI